MPLAKLSLCSTQAPLTFRHQNLCKNTHIEDVGLHSRPYLVLTQMPLVRVSPIHLCMTPFFGFKSFIRGLLSTPMELLDGPLRAYYWIWTLSTRYGCGPMSYAVCMYMYICTYTYIVLCLLIFVCIYVHTSV